MDYSPVRLLVVNGCIMTYGDELHDRLRTGWSALLADRLGVECLNLAACAGSNDRIVRLAVERLPQYAAERGLRSEEVLFLAMWTKLNRFEAFGDEPDRQYGLPDAVLDSGWCRIHPAYIRRRDERSARWYRHLQHRVADKTRFFLNWVMLDSWLARNGFNYGYLWAFEPTLEMFEGMQAYVDQLDLLHVIGSHRYRHGGPSLFDVGRSQNNLGPDRHPLEQSHRMFVDDHVFDWVANLLHRKE